MTEPSKGSESLRKDRRTIPGSGIPTEISDTPKTFKKMKTSFLPIKDSEYIVYASKAVRGFAVPKFGSFFSEMDYEDMIGDTVMKMWRYRDTFDPSKAKLSTWVGTIARNIVLDRAYSNGRNRSLFSEKDCGEYSTFIPSGIGTDDEVLYADTLSSVYSVARDEDDEEIIRLKIEGYDSDEIAQKTGLDIKKVYRDWYRIKGCIRAAA